MRIDKLVENQIPLSEFKRYWERKHNLESYVHPKPDNELIELLFSIAQKSDRFILDHGCGSGRIALALAQNNFKVGLNDISHRAISKTVDLFTRAHLVSRIIHYHVGQIYNWDGPMKWGGFLSYRVLHAIPKFQRFKSIKYLTDGLIIDGEAIVAAKSTNCSRYPLLLHDNDFELIDDGQTFIRKKPFRYIHYFKDSDLLELLKSVGLEVISYGEKKELTGNTLRGTETNENTYWLFHCRKIEKRNIFISSETDFKYDKLVLFDVDGTIIKQSEIITASLRKTFQQIFNLDINLDKYQFYGKTDAQVITDLIRYHFSKTFADVDDPELRRVFAIYAKNYIDLIPNYKLEACECIDKAIEAFSRDKTICLGLLTGNLEGIVFPKLKYVGIDPSKFLIGAFGSDAINRNNLPQIAQNRFEEQYGYRIEFSSTFIIGDTPRDIECAHAVGANIIAVSSGEYSFNTLKKYKPTYILNNVCNTDDLLQIIMK